MQQMKIVVVDYDPSWPAAFEQVRSRVWPVIDDVAAAIEHVGSTSVPGLAAKPIIDIDVVVAAAGDVPAVVERLATLGYEHQGNLGVEGREAFKSPSIGPRHHLYVCSSRGLALANHLAVRNYLRTHSEAAREYGDIKKQLAERFPDDIDGYTEGKTEALLRILRSAGFQPADLEAIAGINRRSAAARSPIDLQHGQRRGADERGPARRVVP